MKLILQCPLYDSFEVRKIAGMFDVPVHEKLCTEIDVEPPPVNDGTWQIGCIVGPSGSGKSSIAKHYYGGNLYLPGNWEEEKAVINGFGTADVKTITSMLTSVGLSSPPSWIKPYSVLSNGEKFRCDLAKALLGKRSQETGVRRQKTEKESGKRIPDSSLVVFDEYTSVVDRNVAKVASAALAKWIRRSQETGVRSQEAAEVEIPLASAAAYRLPPAAFVAVTCHYDILDWLEPDWILDTATGKVSKVRLRRPSIELEIYRCDRHLWDMFKTHHYLSGNLAKNCRCYVAVWHRARGVSQGEDVTSLAYATGSVNVAFCALIPQQGFERWYRVSRIVTLPDYQGIGIGSALLNSLAEMYVGQGYRFSITASHPSILSHCKRSEHWKAITVKKTGSERSRGRAVVSFEWKD